MSTRNRLTAAGVVLLVLLGVGIALAVSGDGAEPKPTDPIDAVVAATENYPLVALAEPHLNQQFHDFLADLLPELAGRVDDIVVEFGNAYFQDVADRFILQQQDVPFDELAQIWRTTIGGRVYWDAPVYEQFFRSLRALNAGLEPNARIRVLLGDVPIDWSQINRADDRDKLPTGDEREPFFAHLVERKVLDRGHRAVLIIGGDHLRRGEYTGPGGLVPSRNSRQPNVGTLLTDAHPGSIYIIADLAPHSSSAPDWDKVSEAFADWPRPSVGEVAGTWLADEPVPFRLLDPTEPEYGLQVDAVLWLGPEEALTESLPDAALYQSGPYAEELRRRSEILTEITGQHVDLVAEGLQLAAGGRQALLETNAQTEPPN